VRYLWQTNERAEYLWRIHKVQNSLTHFTKSLHLNGGKDLQMELEILQIFCIPPKRSVCPPFVTHRQVDNPFPTTPAAPCHDRFMRRQRWFFVSQLRQILWYKEYKDTLTYPHKKTSHGVGAGDFGSQRSSSRSSAIASPIQCRGKCWLRKPQPPAKQTACSRCG